MVKLRESNSSHISFQNLTNFTLTLPVQPIQSMRERS